MNPAGWICEFECVEAGGVATGYCNSPVTKLAFNWCWSSLTLGMG